MSVAKSYAHALFGAAIDQKLTSEALARLEQELRGVTAVFKSSKEARIALLSPITSTKEKISLIEEISKKRSLSPLVTQFLVLLAKKRRLSIAQEISDAFMAARLESEGRLSGQLEVAGALSDAEVQSLGGFFEKKLGKRVVFQVTENPTLLAGIKVTVNGVTYDGTLRSQLQQLRDKFVASASGGQA